MSCNRENVTWQAVDGTWNIGFWAFYDTNTADPDRDYEWDVEYVNDRFWWASKGHPDPEAAAMAFLDAGHQNPGGGYTYQGTDSRLDAILAAYQAEVAEQRRAGDAYIKTMSRNRAFW